MRDPATDGIVAAEQSCCGAVLLRPDVLDLAALEEGQFFDPRHRAVWSAMLELQARAVAIDVTTVEDALAKAGRLDAVGGPSFLAELAMKVPTADNVEHYAAIVREAATTRALALALSEVLARVKGGAVAGDDAIGEALVALNRIDSGQSNDAQTIGDLVRQRFAELERAKDARDRGERNITGIATGLTQLDEKIGGLQRGIVTVGCGRPGSGKSSFGMAVADSVTASGAGVHVFSLEDTRASYTDRAISRLSRVPAEALRNGDLTQEQVHWIARAAFDLKSRSERWLVDDNSGMSAEEIIRAVRRSRRANGTHVVIVDYLQLLRRPRQYENVHDAISQNMHALADAAKAEDLAFLVFSQLNRDLEKREDKRPRQSDLRESGTIEERSKCVLGFYRARMYDQQASEHVAEIHVIKNNNGEQGVFVEAYWDGATTRLDNLSTRSDR